jgi:hypothetical protein
MERLPARAGWLWIRQGFALFRKQPLELSTVFVSYMFLMLIPLSIHPMFGQLLGLILAPMFSLALMQACVHLEQGKGVRPSLLLTGFRSPASRSLLKLGCLYPLAAAIAVGTSAMIDGGVFWSVMSGQSLLDEKALAQTNMMSAMLLAGAVYTPAAMAFWYAAPLIAWKKMPLAKAVFYSFVTVFRAGKAFLLYALAWVAIGIAVSVIVTMIAILLFNDEKAAQIALLPLSIVLTVAMYCSFYPTYTEVFGRPDLPTADPSSTKPVPPPEGE